MSANIDMFTRRALMASVNSPDLELRPTWFLDRYFPTSRQVYAEKIDWELVAASRGLARFRNLGQSAMVVGKLGRTIKTIDPLFINEKKSLTAIELLRENVIGNVYVTDGSSIDTSKKQALARELQDLKNRARRRVEWMASQFLTTGKLQYADDANGVTLEIDLDIDAAYAPVLSGTDLWTDAASDPLSDLDDWNILINQATGGNLKEVTLGTDAYKAFIGNAKVKAQLNNLNFQTGSINTSVQTNRVGVFGGVEVYRYSHKYLKDDGSTIGDMMPANKVLCVADNMKTDLVYATIPLLDEVIAAPFYSDVKDEWDPDVRWLRVMSRPLPLIYEEGSWLYPTVV